MSATSSPTPDDEGLKADDAPSAPPDLLASVDRLVVLGYITAVAMPPIGVILAIVIGLRRVNPSRKHAAAIVVLCVLAAVVWALVIASGAFTATSDSY